MADKVQFNTPVDLESVKSQVLHYGSEFLRVGRQILPRITYFSGSDPVLTITGCAFDPTSHSAASRVIRNMMFSLPALTPGLSVLSMHTEVVLTDRTSPALAVIAFNRQGAIAEIYPYEIDDEGHVEYDMEAKLAPENNGSFTDYISHMLPTFARANKAPFSLKNMVDFLSTHKYELTFHGDWTYAKLRTYHPS